MDDRDSLMAAGADALQHGQFELALANYAKLCALGPEDLDAKFLMAVAASKAGQLDLAVKSFEDVLEKDPENIETLSAFSHVLRAQGRWEEALKLAEKALALRPQSSVLKHNLGRCYLAIGDVQRAGTVLAEAANQNPMIPALHQDMAEVFRRQGRFADAAGAIERSIYLAPGDPEGFAKLADLHLSYGDVEHAIPLLKRAHELEPNSARGLYRLAFALSEEGKLEVAEKAARKALELSPRLADAMSVLGRILQNAGHFEEAETWLRRAIAADPSKMGPYYRITIGKKIEEKDRPLVDEMEWQLSRQDLSNTERASLEYGLGKAYDDLGQYDLAIAHFDEANRIELDKAVKVGRVYDPEADKAFVAHVCSTYTKERFGSLSQAGSVSELPVLIVGMERSGTSLLEQIVSSHPQVAGAGELSFWPKHAEEAERAVLESTEAGGARLTRIAGDYLRILEEASSGEPRVTDKRPDNLAMLGQIHAGLPNARVLWSLRDPVDNCLSIYFTAFSVGSPYLHDREHIVSAYGRHLELLAHWRRVLPANRFKVVRYEDLVADKEAVVRDVVSFLGLPWDDACLRHEENVRTISTPSVWQARQPVYGASTSRAEHYAHWLREFESLQRPGESSSPPRPDA